MVVGLIVVALAMVVAGLVAIVGGSDGIGLESGWALVISGSAVSTGGVLVLALAFILRELRALPDKLEAAHPLDDTADKGASPFERLGPVEQPDAPPIPPVVQGPGFARPVRSVEDKAPTVVARPVKPAEEPATVEPRSSFPPRALELQKDAALLRPPSSALREEEAAEPVDRPPPVFPDFSPRALLEASRAKRKGSRSRPLAPEAAPPGHGIEPTVPIPPEAMRGDERHEPRQEADAATSASVPSEDAEIGPPAEGTKTAEEGKDGPTIVGTYRSNGTVYVMYADGSIEADTPEGLFRFRSLEELKAHIAGNAESSNDKREPFPA